MFLPPGKKIFLQKDIFAGAVVTVVFTGFNHHVAKTPQPCCRSISDGYN